jgi:hypothetical protein
MSFRQLDVWSTSKSLQAKVVECKSPSLRLGVGASLGDQGEHFHKLKSIKAYIIVDEK